MRRNKKGTHKRGIIILLLLFAVILGSLLIMGTSFFCISNVTVQGNELISHDEIIEYAHIGPGMNILRINTKDVAERLKGHPFIMEADIKRKMPREIIINIKERNLVGYIPYMGSYLLVDDEARVISATSQLPIEELPVFNGIKVRDFQSEKVLGIDNNIEYDKIIYISKYIKKSISQYSPIEVDVMDLQDIVIRLGDRFVLGVGDIRELSYKLEFSNTILEKLYPQDVGGEIDVSRGEKAFFRPW